MVGIKPPNNAKIDKSSNKKASRQNTGKFLTLPVNDIFVCLNTSTLGLTSQEAEKRLEIYGRNELAKKRKRTTIIKFLYFLRNPLVIILLLAGIISSLIGETVNAAIIFLMVLLSVLLNVYQESKAEKAAELLKEKVTTTAALTRDGVKKEVKISEVVPGDIVLLSAGDMVPADAKVVAAKDLFIDQSALTGESFPVEKSIAIPSETAIITERKDCLF